MSLEHGGVFTRVEHMTWTRTRLAPPVAWAAINAYALQVEMKDASASETL